MKELKMKKRFAINTIYKSQDVAYFYTDKKFLENSGLGKYGTITDLSESRDNWYTIEFDGRYDRAEVIAYLKKLESESTVGETVVESEKTIVYGKEGKGKIRIVAKEFLFNGEKAIEIISIENVKAKGELPTDYWSGDGLCMYQQGNGLHLRSKNIKGKYRLPIASDANCNAVRELGEWGGVDVKKGNVYFLDTWEKILEEIEGCGRILAAINANLKKQAEGWGKERIYYI